MKDSVSSTKIDNQLETIFKTCYLDCYRNKIHQKIDNYLIHKNYSHLIVKLHLLFFCFKSFFKFDLSYKSEYSDNICHILLSPKGGLGDHLCFLKYCFCLRKKFQNTVKIDVLLEKKDKSLKDSIYKQIDYIDCVFIDKCPKPDVAIDLIRFPRIQNVDIKRLKLVCNTNLIEYLFCISKFMNNDELYRSDYLGRSYSQIFKRTRENQADIEDLLKMSSLTDFTIPIDDDMVESTLSKFGLLQDNYVVFQTGAGYHFQDVKTDTRQWPIEHYQKAVSLLREKHPEIKFIQCGDLSHNRINNVDIDLLGKTTLEEVFALIKSAKLLISAEGGYPIIRHFVSRKVSCVLFGPTNKNFFGFEENLNISSNICPGCEWINKIWYKKCLLSNDQALCMKSLSPEKLVANIEQEHFL